MEVSLQEMLEAREARVRRQEELLGRFGKPMVSFSMNIAGPVKESPLIAQGFAIGLRRLEQMLPVEGIACLAVEKERGKTGCEAMLVLDGSPEKIKAVTSEIEERDELGRLFDMDVLDARGQKLGRTTPRRCLICGEIAQVCARSRTHTVQQLQKKTKEILEQAVLEENSRCVARLAQQALLYEVGITPKPGLVDRENNGSHSDMDFFTFQRSAAALYPYFEDCAVIGRRTRAESPERTFALLRAPGKAAQGQMLAATGGVNTHKGAIFSLGILCGALGRLDRTQWADSKLVLEVCGQMTKSLLADFTSQDGPGTVGQTLYREYGITGVRGQAAAGFPEVLKLALPKLREGLRLGLSLNESAWGCLMELIAHTVDTCLIHRGGYARQQQIAAQAQALLREQPFPDRETMEVWNARFVAENLSPGGCADLLSMTLMLYFLEEEANE